MLSTLSLIAITFIGVLWTLPCILLLIVRVRLFKITTRRTVIALSKQVSSRSTILINGTDPSGFFFGRWYLGYIHETESHQGNKSTEVYLLCTNNQYKKLTDNNKPQSSPSDTPIKIWERTGNFFRINYAVRELNLGEREVRENQMTAIEKIKEKFNQRGHAVVYIHGVAGTGKSMTSLLLARDISASYCMSFNPTDPGDNIADLYAKVAPTKANPLVIVLDEVDIILEKIHTNSVPMVKYIPVAIKDKTSWNMFFDTIDLGMYRWLIVIMTSNKSPEWVRGQLCESYIREGRVDLQVVL